MYCYDFNQLKELTKTENVKQAIKTLEEVYEREYKDKPISVINYSLIKKYYQTGDREAHQKIYFERRKRFALLQILAITDDKYLEPLEEIISVICDEFTWVLPAHNLIKEESRFDYTIIDLFSSETGFYLAETAYVFKDKLSNDIKMRIKISLEDKIVKNYESRTFNFDSLENNWAAVCSASVGAVYLYAFPEKFPQIEDRIINAFKNYLVSIDDEGYCAEGMGYWTYGFGFFCIFFDIYYNLTGKWHNLLDLPKVQNAINYFNNSNLGGGEFLPFADGGVKKAGVDVNVLYAIKNLFKEKVILTENYPLLNSNRVLGLRYILGKGKYLTEQKPTEGTYFYSNNQVFIHKNHNYSFVAKGGSNHEPHGHLDVGAFQICKNGKRLIADLGAGEYTFGYFNNRDDSLEGRFGDKIFVCSSFAHSVPIVNGKPQPFNLENDNAVVLEQTDKVFKLDISACYVDNAKIFVTYTTLENVVKIKYECKDVEDKVTFRFVSDYKPEISAQGVKIEEALILNDMGIMPVVKEKEYSDHYATKQTAYLIDYSVRGEQRIELEFTIKLKL